MSDLAMLPSERVAELQSQLTNPEQPKGGVDE